MAVAIRGSCYRKTLLARREIMSRGITGEIHKITRKIAQRATVAPPVRSEAKGSRFVNLVAHAADIEQHTSDYAQQSWRHTLLDFYYAAGKCRTDNVVYTTAAGFVALTNTATNYIEADPGSGIVSANTVGFTTLLIPLYTAVTAGGVITIVTDCRCFL